MERHESSPLDAYAASHRAIRELKSEVCTLRRLRIRSSKYLNNIVEQDHRRIKARVQPMLGFKTFYSARRVILGIELMQMLHKGQFQMTPV